MLPQLDMDEDTCLRMIMGYLRDKGLIQSMLQLEKQSNIQYEVHSKEIQFFRKVLTDGDFRQAINFLEPFEAKLNEKHFKTIIMTIHRQRLFELIENPDEIQLKDLLERDIIQWCTEEEYQELFQCLTLKSMKELPGFEKWTIYKGRLSCFQTIKPYIQLIQSQVVKKQSNTPKLEDLFLQFGSKSRDIYRPGQITFQEQPLKEQSRQESRNPSMIEDKKRQQPDKRFLYPKINEYEEPYSNKVSSRPISQKDNFTFSDGKKTDHNYKLKLLSTVLDDRAIRVCQFSHDGKMFAVGTNSSYIKIFNVSDIFEDCKPRSELELVYEIQGLHSKSIFSLDWTYNKKMMVTCSNDATVKLTKFNNYFKSHESFVLGRHEGCIRMVRFDSIGTKAISCAQDFLVKIWDIQKTKLSHTLKGHSSSVNAIKIDNSNIYSVGKDCTLRMWDLRSGQTQGVSKACDSEMTYIARGTENHVISHKNGNLSFYNSSLQAYNVIKVHQDEIRSVEGLLEQNLLITSSFDGNVCILKILENRIMQQYHRHNSIKEQDKVVHAVFNRNLGFASSSNLGVCNIFAMI